MELGERKKRWEIEWERERERERVMGSVGKQNKKERGKKERN